MQFHSYFQSYSDYFWAIKVYQDDFGDSHTVYEVPFGSTIAYTDYVVDVLDFLSDESIPPLGSLLLAIMATNPESKTSMSIVEVFAMAQTKKGSQKSNFFRPGAAMDFLRQLADLPQEYRMGEKRMLLLQTIFANCHNRVSGERAQRIFKNIRSKEYDVFMDSSSLPFNEGTFIKDFRTIALLKVKFPTVQSIINAMENLPLEEAATRINGDILEEKEATDEPKDLIRELIEEDRTFQVGSLIKRIWSGLNIPLHHNIPSQQPLGGISDLTNKGDFDKLLISEFAHDDDVFMSRIANHEALYIQREVPPEAETFQRIILIDSTLKNWGNPKILAFASALAIAKHPKTDIECRIFVVGNGIREVYFENVLQVITGLSELSGKLDCSEGLHQFFTENKINAKNQEVFLIASEDSLKLAPMQKTMSDHFEAVKYILTTNTTGDVSIFRNQNKGKKLLQQMTLPLGELWVKTDTDNHRNYSSRDTHAAIPILYPVERNYRNIFHSNGDFFLYSNGNLFLFPKEGFGKGFEKIASNLSFDTGYFALRTNSSGQKLLLHFSIQEVLPHVSILNLTTNELKRNKVFSAISSKAIAVFECNDDFYVTDNVTFWRIDNDSKLVISDEEEIKTRYDDNHNTLLDFVGKYKRSKPKYNVIKRLEQVVVEDNELILSNYRLNDLEFVKGNKLKKTSGTQSIALEMNVHLILKRKGTRPIQIIKIIKENTGKSLQESKNIVEGDLEILLANVKTTVAENMKLQLEKAGAVCYIAPASFESKDGSLITNQDGILVFESSNKQIPRFYIPFVSNMDTFMATDTNEWAGNIYFLPEESVLEDKGIRGFEFKKKHLDPFILNIVKHAT